MSVKSEDSLFFWLLFRQGILHLRIAIAAFGSSAVSLWAVRHGSIGDDIHKNLARLLRGDLHWNTVKSDRSAVAIHGGFKWNVVGGLDTDAVTKRSGLQCHI